MNLNFSAMTICGEEGEFLMYYFRGMTICGEEGEFSESSGQHRGHYLEDVSVILETEGSQSDTTKYESDEGSERASLPDSSEINYQPVSTATEDSGDDNLPEYLTYITNKTNAESQLIPTDKMQASVREPPPYWKYVVLVAIFMGFAISAGKH